MREREKKETAREREGEKNEKLKRKPLISTRGVRLFTLGCCQKKKKDNDDDNDVDAAVTTGVDFRQRRIMNLFDEYVLIIIMKSKISFV